MEARSPRLGRGILSNKNTELDPFSPKSYISPQLLDNSSRSRAKFSPPPPFGSCRHDGTSARTLHFEPGDPVEAVFVLENLARSKNPDIVRGDAFPPFARYRAVDDQTIHGSDKHPVLLCSAVPLLCLLQLEIRWRPFVFGPAFSIPTRSGPYNNTHMHRIPWYLNHLWPLDLVVTLLNFIFTPIHQIKL